MYILIELDTTNITATLFEDDGTPIGSPAVYVRTSYKLDVNTDPNAYRIILENPAQDPIPYAAYPKALTIITTP